ncbi:MAG: hypothetical protein ACRDZR_03655 [Acidimicrobiales bacterium]
MTAMIWTLIALIGAAMVAMTVDARSGRRELRTELKGDITGLRTELKADINGLRTELKADINGLRTELNGDTTGLKGEIDGLRSEVHLLAERQAEMNGRLDLVAAMAHTHPPAVAGQQG